MPPSKLLPLSPSSCPRFTECFSSQSFDSLLLLPVLPRTSLKEFREQSSHFCVCVKITCWINFSFEVVYSILYSEYPGVVISSFKNFRAHH